MTPPPDLVRRFQEALQRAEASGDVEALVALFDPEAELMRLNHLEPARGQEGARRFWQGYLAQFEVVRTEFGPAVLGEHAAAFEWLSEGTLAGGQPIRYRGVSVLEFKGEAVACLRTYYDSAAFLPAGAKVKEGQPTPEDRPQMTG